MTQEEILEGNKLIAEFMDSKVDNNYYTFEFLKSNLRTGLVNKNSELHFHSSWNWLMPVVEKIERHGYGFHTAPYAIEVVEYLSGAEKTIIEVDRYELTMIEMYYQATIEFIKWHNNL